MRSLVLGVLLLFSSTAGFAYDDPIRADSPTEYLVRKGDTLWDISSRFLKNPWLWPDIWDANPQVNNPHLIYPGDIIRLTYVDGQPRLTLAHQAETEEESEKTIKLHPTIRKRPTKVAIPTIPLGAIDSFLKNSRIFDSEMDLASAPYVFASEQNRAIAAQGDKVYVRGAVDSLHKSVKLYRASERIIDPDSGELLGVAGKDIATASLLRVDAGVATLRIQHSTGEVLAGDRAMPEDTFNLDGTFFLKAPNAPVSAKIISSPGGLEKIGRYNSVIVNRGLREGLMAGDILLINKHIQAKDNVTGELVTLPPERAGIVMIYRPFEKVSYGIVLTAYEEISVGDTLNSP